MRIPATTLGAFFVLAVASGAHAEPSHEDKAAATALFKEAKALMTEKSYALACRKFEESQRLDPGGGTLLNLAVCHELEGRTATAWSELHEARAIAKRDGQQARIELADKHLAALEPVLSRLTITVPSESDLAGLTVRRDGTILGRAAWGVAIPVDPGEHVLEASAKGHAPWTARVRVGERADLQLVTVPLLPPREERDDEPAHAAPKAVIDWRTTGTALLGGAGAAGLAAGGLLGIAAISRRKSSDARCPNGHCSVEAVRLNDTAKDLADAATITMSVGAAAVATSVVLWLTRGKPPATSVAPTVGVDRFGVSLARHF